MRRVSVPKDPLFRALLAGSVVLALATTVAMAILWPRGDSGLQFDQLGREQVPAVVVEVTDECVSLPVQPCSRVTVRLDDDTNLDQLTSFDVGGAVEIDPGDKVLVIETGLPPGTMSPSGVPLDSYSFSDFERRGPIVWFAVLFALIIVAIARWTGVRALVALCITMMIVVFFIVPAIARGSDPLLIAIVGTFAIALITIPLAYGLNIKTLAATAGTGTSLVLTVLLATFAVDVAHITGQANEEAIFLRAMDNEFSLAGLLIAGMVIGALGVLDDLTVSQASTVLALRQANPNLGFRQLFSGAFGVGKDHLIATVNTLVLAYAGAALPVMLIFSGSETAFGAAINSEVVAADIVSMLVGGIGLVAAVPITTALAAVLATRTDPESIVNDGGHHH